MERHGRSPGQGGHDRAIRQGAQEIGSTGSPSFAVPAEEGRYLVELELGGIGEPSSTTVWAESRRLMLEEVAAEPGRVVRRTIAVAVKSPELSPPPPNAPGGKRVLLPEAEALAPDWDGRLSLDFAGASPSVRSVSVAEAPGLPALFLAGDSTVADQPAEPYASWGQMLPRFLGPGIAVANHAASGETLKSFISSLRLAKVLELIRPGDYLLIQFGHNDQKREWPQTFAEAGSTFKAYLRAYVAEARLRGAEPILATPPRRRKFGPGGAQENTHGAYPDAARELALEEGLALVDLEADSGALYGALGPGLSRSAFAAPGDETHHGSYGALQLAKCVARALARSSLPLAGLVEPGAAGYDPSEPDPVPTA